MTIGFRRAVIAGVTALTVLSLGTGAAGTASGSGGDGPVKSTLRTKQFLGALERKDTAAVSALLAPDARWVVHMTAAGTQQPDVTTGREQITAALNAVGAPFNRVRFVEQRISVAGGRTIFVQAHGDFMTIDGRPYRNVYVFRFDWRDGQLATWEEYANPVIICRTFGRPDCA